MKKIFMKFSTAALLLILLTSCIDIETTVTVEEDGSGTLLMEYSVSKLIMELGKLDEEDDFAPLPVSEADLLATAALSPGLEVRSVNVRENEKDVLINAEFVFSSVADMSRFFSPDRENDPALSLEGDETVFRYTLFTAVEGEISEESMNMIDSFFSEDEIRLRLEAPEDISSVSIGTITGNGRVAEYAVTLPEIFQENADIIWEVRW